MVIYLPLSITPPASVSFTTAAGRAGPKRKKTDRRHNNRVCSCLYIVRNRNTAALQEYRPVSLITPRICLVSTALSGIRYFLFYIDYFLSSPYNMAYYTIKSAIVKEFLNMKWCTEKVKTEELKEVCNGF